MAGCVPHTCTSQCHALLQVHELKKLAHELFEVRDTYVKEIQQLKEDAKTGAPTPSSNGMFPGRDMAAVHEQNAVLQVHGVLFASPRSSM